MLAGWTVPVPANAPHRSSSAADTDCGRTSSTATSKRPLTCRIRFALLDILQHFTDIFPENGRQSFPQTRLALFRHRVPPPYFLFCFDYFIRQSSVGLRPFTPHIILKDRLAARRRFAQLDVPRNVMMIDPVLEVLAHLLLHLHRQLRAGIKHRQQHAFDHQIRVEQLLHQTNRQQQLSHTFQCIIFALHRNDDRVRSGQRIGVEQTQGRRTVDDDIVISIPYQLQLLF